MNTEGGFKGASPNYFGKSNVLTLWGEGRGGLCLTFCDRQTTLSSTCLYDTFCVENCVTFGGEG